MTPITTRAPDPGDQVRAVRRAHETFLSSGRAPGVRALVAESWRRSAAAGVNVDAGEPPLISDRAALARYRAAHPLARVFPLLYDVLGRAAQECDVVMAVGDAHGQLLWVSGRTDVLGRAERIGFVEGSTWAEADAGTNAPGTALRIDAPVQIMAAEHFARPVQPWTCAAVPIHDPVTRAVLGIVDVTGRDEVASPQTLAMVRAAARIAEAELGRLLVVGSPAADVARSDDAASRAGRLAVSGLGRSDCLVELDGRTVRLSPRHSEILTLLADRPDGVTADELAVLLYPADVSPSTMRAELARLRSLLGADLLDSRPYRLRRPPVTDWGLVDAELAAGRTAGALRAYRGPLLPASEAPGVVDRRDRLAAELRGAVYACGQVDLLAAWTRSRWGADDRELWLRQRELAPDDSPLAVVARAEIGRLDRELGLPHRP